MKQTIEKDIKFSRLSQNENFYKYIFKKTEKVVAAVFYILGHVSDNSGQSPLAEQLSRNAREVHAISLDALQHFEHAADEVLMKYTHALIALESTARLCAAAGLLTTEVVNVLAAEIDAIHRGIQNRYLVPGTQVYFGDAADAPATPARVSSGTDASGGQRAAVAPSASSSVSSGTSTPDDRRARIKTVLEAKGEANIKDIATVITDVSEKTIQRELNAMIEDNTIRRIGERRWSRYTLK